MTTPITRRAMLGWIGVAGSATILVACSPASGPQTSAPTATEATPGQSAGVTLAYWSWLPTDNSRWGDRPKALDAFRQKTGITVEPANVDPFQMPTKIQAAVAANQVPDLADPAWIDAVIAWGRQGITVELSDVMAKIRPDDIAQTFRNLETYKGQVFGIPWIGSPMIMFYRKDWLAESGLPMTNWDEFLEVAKKFTGKNPAGKDGYGLGGQLAAINQPEWTQDWLGPNNGMAFDKDWNVVLDTLDQNRQALDYMKRFSEYFQPGAINAPSNDTKNLFADEVLFATYNDAVVLGIAAKTNPDIVDKIGMQLIPQGPSGDGSRGAYLGVHSLVVFAGSKNVDAGKSYLTWIHEPDVYLEQWKSFDPGFMPVHDSTAKDPKLAKYVSPAILEAIKVGNEASKIGTSTGMDFGPNPLARDIQAENIWMKMNQRALSDPPQDVLKEAADSIRRIVKDRPEDLG